MVKILDVLEGKKTSPPPVWLMRQAGRYLPEYRKLRSHARDFLHFCYTPELSVEATLQPIRRYDLSAAIIFSDILVIPDALGQTVAFTEGEGPQLPPLAPGDLAGLRARLQDGALPHKLAPVYEAIGAVRASLPKDTALLGFAGAPWTLATYMLGGGAPHDFAHLIRTAETEPDFCAALFDILSDAIIHHLDLQVAAGAQAVQIFDSWAGALSANSVLYRRWVIEPHRRILEGLRQLHPKLPIIAFPRGSSMAYEDFCVALGDLLRPGAISLDQNTSLEFAARKLQPILPIQGNLAPDLLLSDDFTACAEAVRHICAMLGNGAHIFNLGHGVDKTTDPDKITRLIEVINGSAA